MAAAKKLVLNAGRQYPLVLEQAFTHENLDGTLATLIAKVPRNGVITAGSVHVTTAFGTGAKLCIGTAADDDAYGELDVATVGTKALVPTNAEIGAGELYAKAPTAVTAGAGVLRITYFMTGRANEVFA